MARRMDALSEALKSVAGGEFILVALSNEGPQPVYDHAGALLCFKTGNEAGDAANQYSSRLGVKVQPRRAVDKTWRQREGARMKDGTYQMLPWHDQDWWKGLASVHADHFPHVSLQKQALIAFTEDEGRGSADLQTTLKPGRYLERYFSDKMNEYLIRDLVMVFSKKFEDNVLQFAADAEEFEEVYTTGPSSCMSKTAGSYCSSTVHPVRMYAAGDLQLAYMRRNGRIAARVIVWPEKKIYSTIYGDRARLEPLLTKQGYKCAPPYGARLLKHKVLIPKDDENPGGGAHRYLCPHIDSVGWVKDDGGEFLVVGGKTRTKGEGLEVPGGGGFTEPFGFKCSVCNGEHFTPRNMVSYYMSDTKNGSMCQGCAEGKVVTCCYTGANILKDQAVEMVSPPGAWGWVREVKKGRIVKCEGSGKYTSSNETVRMAKGGIWSVAHFRKFGRYCPACALPLARSDTDGCPSCNKGK